MYKHNLLAITMDCYYLRTWTSNKWSLIGQHLTCHPMITENEKAQQIRAQHSPSLCHINFINQEHDNHPPKWISTYFYLFSCEDTFRFRSQKYEWARQINKVFNPQKTTNITAHTGGICKFFSNGYFLLK